ncbi:MAG: hypothetical protein LBL92_06855, partial [Propionibacteriaceae bacterium]|nr:hypothetical protein [Propionibacteriaceae bacterium]
PEGPVQNPDAIPVAEATETALLRAQLEVNNAIFPLMFEGITLREAGMEWFAGPNREDDYRGRPEEDPGDRERGLVAVIAEGQDLPEAGTAIMAGEVEIGKVFIKAPLVGLETGYGLALLDAPFEVPGLALMCGDVEIKTIPRPAVEPVSWVKAIGDSTGPTALQEAMAELTAQRTEQAEAAARAAAEAEAKTEAADPELAAALAQLDLEDEEAMETEEYKAWAEAVGRARAQATLETIEAKVAVASTKTNADSEAAEDEE